MMLTVSLEAFPLLSPHAGCGPRSFLSFISKPPAGIGRAVSRAAVASGVSFARMEFSFVDVACRCQGILRTNGDDRDEAKLWANGIFLSGVTFPNGEVGILLRIPLDTLVLFFAFTCECTPPLDSVEQLAFSDLERLVPFSTNTGERGGMVPEAILLFE